ncbi:MAG: M23 family metallopeptidase [Fibrobacterales bacterium]
MKKIDLEVYPTNNSNEKFQPKYFEITATRIGVVLILIGLSVSGFLFFDYETIYNNLFSPQLEAIKANNARLEATLVETTEQLNVVKQNVYSIKKINQKVTALAGKDSLTTLINGEGLDSLELPKLHYQIFNLKHSYHTTDSLFKRNPNWRASIPVIHPLKKNFSISNYFANNLDPFTGKHMPHLGIDYVSSLKDIVIATGGGTIAESDKNDLFGHYVLIHHYGTIYSFYAHLNQRSVRQGNRVKRGDTIGRLGNSGRSSGPHLHYEVRIGKQRVNPLNYILSDLPN